MSSTTTQTFQYVLIPSDPSSPLTEKLGDKSGGLSDDFLQKQAKEHFWNENKQSIEEIKALDKASKEQRHEFAQQIRSTSSNSAMSKTFSEIDDDTLIKMIQTAQSTPNCEIIALTIPTTTNRYHSVSMYVSPNCEDLPFNSRATELLKSCGHNGTVKGDAFVGRCIDNEIDDIWTRVDFTVKDADPESEWCRIARGEGGGGGRQGAGGAPSLGGLMGKTMNDDSGGDKEEEGYVWSQTNDEVELKFVVESNVKSKDVRVTFKMKYIKVVILKDVLLEGETGGDVIVDESTYTIQNVSKDGKKELCITLTKRNEFMWDYPVKK